MIIKDKNDEYEVNLIFICNKYDDIIRNTISNIQQDYTPEDYGNYEDELEITERSDVECMKELTDRLNVKLKDVIEFSDISCELDWEYLTISIYVSNPDIITNEIIDKILDIINESELEIKIRVEGETDWVEYPSNNWYEPNDYDYTEVDEYTYLYLTDYEFLKKEIY